MSKYEEYVKSIYPKAEVRSGNFLNLTYRTTQYAVFPSPEVKHKSGRLAACGWNAEEAWKFTARYLKSIN